MRSGRAAAKPGRLATWRASVARELRERPGRTVALSLGTGFILGGGLFTPLAARIVGAGLRLGLRLAVLPLVGESLLALGEGALARGRAPSIDVEPSESHPNKRKHTHEAQ